MAKKITFNYANFSPGKISLEIVNMMGETFYSKEYLINKSGGLELPFSDVPDGIYSVIFRQSNNKVTVKMVINNI